MEDWFRDLAFTSIETCVQVTMSPGTMLCASSQDEWPDVVVAHELYWAKGGQLRFICAAKLDYIRSLLPMLKKVNMDRLCGPVRKRSHEEGLLGNV